MSKTLGQVAREAYENAIEAHARSEHQLGFPRDSFWQAAAEAVELAVGPQPVIDDLDARMPKAVAERAVIEAAKRLSLADVASVALGQPPAERLKTIATFLTSLGCAVEALEEVEGE